MKTNRFWAASFLAAASLLVGTCTPAAAALRAVTFVSPTTGWVAGDGVILGTTDGGKTWQSQYTGRVQISSLSFATGLIGWAAGVDPIPGTGVLLGTRDGGHTWGKLGEPRNPARTISFGSVLSGYAVAGGSALTAAGATERTPPFFGGRLANTSDGGRSWRMLDNPLLVDTACASSSQIAFAAYQAAVLRSEDGGDTFFNVFSPHIDTKRVWYASVHCAGNNVAYAQFSSTPVGDQRPYIVYRTTDGGSHWQPMLMNKMTEDAYLAAYQKIGDAPGPWPGPFTVVDADTAFFLGMCPGCGTRGAVSITGTRDGGTTWQAIATIPDVTLAGPVAVSFADAVHGWVVGTSAAGASVIATTADGGLTWTKQNAK